ncbi:bifunctional oligoribonuclease/PAP phosphatase NrnA [Desulfuromonas carbonis]|uniref:DHH family phosphoesterase n=1 Tax=Desulfuromonas sp. DDH964 TaxID=1823759 RepID=UPI00078C4271|nr:DHH family phosphoesterase [Desulfuromonas sp. DDH964]AMV72083.1 phosphoesterase [Desulfuromonas sp. DDH964]
MLKAILKTINEGERFLVASHAGPDGDALASTLALTLALRELGKEVVAYNRDGVPAAFDFLPGAATVTDRIEAGARFDAGFILDAGELRRAGSELRDHCTVLANIDHHPYSEQFGSIHYVDTEACATGAMVYRILAAGGWPISREVASCIYAAIISDTGSFRYSNSNPEAFRIAGDMIALGVSPWEIATGLYENQDARRLQLLALALATLTLSACGRYASISVTSDMYAATGSSAEHTDGFVNYPRSIRNVEVAIFFRQVSPTAFKVGFRSKGTVDVGALSRELGGGGHHNAAGAEVSGTLEQVRQTVFSRLKIPVD